MTYLKNITFFSILGLFGLSLSSCDELTVSKNSELKNIEIDSTKTNLVNVAGKLFSIPSPIQTAILIKDSDVPYNREVLNDPASVTNYSTKNERALNLGVYGTEMAYTSLYDDNQWSLRYYKAIEKLSEELEIKGALSPTLVKRLGNNIGNTDSLLFLSGKFYEAADQYLKENERYELAALILTGGWVESNYLTALSANAGNEPARERLAAQKKTINTLCDVLHSSTDSQFKSGITMKQLDSLKNAYSTVKHAYTFVKPETNAETKTTIINSESKFNLTDEELADISARIERIRNSIIKGSHE